MYYIGETRTLTTKSKCDGIHVIINDTISNEQIDLSPERWKAFRTQFPTISAAVNEQKENQFVKYLHEIGDDWYVSVTNGFFTVDIRQFYKSKDGRLISTWNGIALRTIEWENLTTCAPTLDLNPLAFDVYDEGDQSNYRCNVQ